MDIEDHKSDKKLPACEFAEVDSIRDIPERKWTEIQLQNGMTLNTSILDMIDNLVMVCDREGRVKRFNKSCERISGYSFEQIKGRYFWDYVIPSEDIEQAKALFNRPEESASPAMPDKYENRWLTREGKHRIISWTTSCLSDKDGSTYAVSIGSDISCQRQVEERLYQSEAELSTIFKNAHGIIYTLSDEGKFLFVSPGWTETLGHDISEVEGQSFEIFVHPDYVHVCKSFLERVIATDEPQKGVEYIVKHRNGTWHWYTSSGAPVKDKSGRTLYYVGLAIDITERKKAEEALNQYSQQLEQLVGERTRELDEANREISNILESISDNFVAFNKKLQFVYVNKAAEKIIGLRGDLIGQTLEEVNPDYNRMALEIYQQVLREQKPRYFEAFFEQYQRWMAVTVYPSNEGISVYSRDITDRKQLEKEIARLDRLNLIGEIAASIGHEIRNPLTSIRGFLQMLKCQDEYEKDMMFFDLMIEELDRANDIITRFLAMAKDKRVDLQPQYLDEVIKYLYPMIKADANYKDMDVDLNLGKPPMPLIDAKEIRQMILNMARNGLEAMSPGGILTIGTTLEGNDIILYIKDQGRGLKPELIDKLGTPFLTTKENGTGLGLAVCYSIAARHNARIDFETGPEGTTFFVRFPLPRE